MNLNYELKTAFMDAGEEEKAIVTPEAMILSLLKNKNVKNVFEKASIDDIENLENCLKEYIQNNIPNLSPMSSPSVSASLKEALDMAEVQAINSGRKEIMVHHFVKAVIDKRGQAAVAISKHCSISKLLIGLQDLADGFSIDEEAEEKELTNKGNPKKTPKWKDFVVEVTDPKICNKRNLLIGRDEEIERTIQILSRKTKNNPVHIGEAGVGKTSIVYGLADRINKGEVPKQLEKTKIYSLDLTSLIAGTQFRGEFEDRIQAVLKGVEKEGNAIIYIDEIHMIVGAGATGNGNMDASNILKPYLESGEIRFIGSTTDEEYKKAIEKNKALDRRFQPITVEEPTVAQTIDILKGLKKTYEEYHEVEYTNEAIVAAVELSAKYINDRRLPDKAIDIIDEAGACLKLSSITEKVVDVKLINDTLSKIAKIPSNIVEKDETEILKNLADNIKGNVYGQDEAVDKVVEAIKLSRAGLTDEDKPIASLLFVGPTGVGKTEIAKTVAKELDIELIRFDMSEYMEKHSVSKLIGAPAGYVGYEEGGLLVDAVKKHPHCVLLFDEIEKAHPDVFNMMLQMMDYATLTDNQGRKADFRNAIIIFTSNAGAALVGKKSMGFNSTVTTSSVITDTVNSTFSPEFRNRLTGTVVFNPMDNNMAVLIANKAIRTLENKLQKKSVKITLTKKAMDFIIQKGITDIYGAREIQRVVDREVKPLLVNEILFGSLTNGGKAKIDYKETEDKLYIVSK